MVIGVSVTTDKQAFVGRRANDFPKNDCGNCAREEFTKPLSRMYKDTCIDKMEGTQIHRSIN